MPQKLPQICTVIVCICIQKVTWFAVYIFAVTYGGTKYNKSAEIRINIVLTSKLLSSLGALPVRIISGTASGFKNRARFREGKPSSRVSGSENWPSLKWCSQTRKDASELISPVYWITSRHSSFWILSFGAKSLRPLRSKQSGTKHCLNIFFLYIIWNK